MMESYQDQCAYYYSKDSIDNLQIRVILHQLTGTELVNASPRAVDESGYKSADIALSSFPSKDTKTEHHQQVEISWQEKILSPTEAEEYQKVVYSKDTKYKSYYQQALRRKKHQKEIRIFTYIHEDQFKGHGLPATSSSRVENDHMLHQRMCRKSSKTLDRSVNSEEPELEEENQTTSQDFYIMADLAPSNSLGEGSNYEVVLGKLLYDNQGELTISPDFTLSSSTKPYRLEDIAGDNALYQYTIENVSLIRTKEDKQQEHMLSYQVVRQRIEDLQIEDFTEEVKDGETRVIVVGEITKIWQFPSTATSLYVHYILNLPPGWRTNDGCNNNGFTPTCSAVYDGQTYVAHFSTPLYIDVTCTASGYGRPSLLLSVYSVDCWSRDRDEGYGVIPLPLPGENCAVPEDLTDYNADNLFTVNMWRPAQVTPTDKLRRYFLGGWQLITDSSYLVPSHKLENSRTSRLGFQTESSGCVELRLHSMLHTSSGIDSPSINIHSGWQLSTQTVLEAFHKSCQNLRAAKNKLT